MNEIEYSVHLSQSWEENWGYLLHPGEKETESLRASSDGGDGDDNGGDDGEVDVVDGGDEDDDGGEGDDGNDGDDEIDGYEEHLCEALLTGSSWPFVTWSMGVFGFSSSGASSCVSWWRSWWDGLTSPHPDPCPVAPPPCCFWPSDCAI